MPHRRWPYLLLFVVCTAGMVAAEDVTVSPRIGEPELKAARERFQALQGRKLDPKLLDALAKLMKDNPKAKPEDLARKLLAERPDLLEAKNLDALRELTRQTKQPDAKAPPIRTKPNPFEADPRDVPPKSPPAVPEPDQRDATVPPSSPKTSAGPEVRPERKLIEQPTEPKPPKLPNPVDPTVPPPAPRLGSEGPRLRPLPRPDTPSAGITPLPTADGDPQAVPPSPPGNPQEYQAAAQWWEKNFGPLKDSPAMQDLLTEFLKGQPGQSKSPFTKMLEGTKLPDVGKMSGVPKSLGLDSLKLGGLIPELPQAPSTPSGPKMPGFGGFNADLSGLGTWMLIPVVLAVFGFVAFRLLRRRGWFGSQPIPLTGLGPWPVDPRAIRSRDDLVKAFEYLSVLTIGGPARHYHHGTIAAELDRLLPDAGDLPQEVARHYMLARYGPSGAEIDADDLAAARASLCRLAGVKP